MLSIGYTAFKYCLYRVPISEGFRCGIRVLVTVDEFDVRKNFASPRYDLREWNVFIGLSVTIFHGKFRIKRLGILGLVASGVRTESDMKYCFTNIAYLAFFICFFLYIARKVYRKSGIAASFVFFIDEFRVLCRRSVAQHIIYYCLLLLFDCLIFTCSHDHCHISFLLYKYKS